MQHTVKDIRSILTTIPPTSTYATGTTRDDYVSLVGINPSSLASGLIGHDDVNPEAIKLAWESPDSTERTAASQDRLDRGTLAHLMVLQPELLMDRVAVWRGGKRYSNEWTEFNEEHAGKLIITANDYATVATAIKGFASQRLVAPLLCGIESEVAMVSSEKCQAMDGSIILKGQVDGVSVSKFTIIDLKTTENGIDERSVQRTIRTFHYREKMAMYRRLMARATDTRADAWSCYNIFLSMAKPSAVVIEKFTTDALEWGVERIWSAIRSVEACLAKNEWPMYVRSYFMGVEMYEMDDGSGVEVNYE